MKPKFVLKSWLEDLLIIVVILQFACMTGITTLDHRTVVFLACMIPWTLVNLYVLVNYGRSFIEG